MLDEKKNCEKCVHNVWDLKRSMPICTNEKSEHNQKPVGMLNRCDKWEGINGH